MKNYEFIISKLGDMVLDHVWTSVDLMPNQTIEFIENQTHLMDSVLYICSASYFEKVYKDLAIEPGTIIFICGLKESGRFLPFAQEQGISIIECRSTSGATFNTLSKSISLLEENLVNTTGNVTDDDMQRHLRHFWKLIMQRKLINKRDIYEALAAVGPNINRFYRIGVINRELPSTGISEVELIDYLLSVIPDAYIFSNPLKPYFEIIVIQFFDEQPFESTVHENNLGQVFKEKNLYTMIGNSTRDFSKMATLYSLISRANFLAYRLTNNADTRFHFYKDYSVYMMLDMCADKYRSSFGHDDILYLGHPVPIHLFRYDQKHGTNLLDVLYHYLNNNQDIKKTSADLYMHRNTVTNKINLIKKICPVDFENGSHNQLMMFTCQLIKYYESIMQLKLKNNITSIEDEENTETEAINN